MDGVKPKSLRALLGCSVDNGPTDSAAAKKRRRQSAYRHRREQARKRRQGS